MTIHTPRDRHFRLGDSLEANAADLSPEAIRFYVAKGRRLQSQAFAAALRSLGRRLIGRSVRTEERPPVNAKPA